MHGSALDTRDLIVFVSRLLDSCITAHVGPGSFHCMLLTDPLRAEASRAAGPEPEWSSAEQHSMPEADQTADAAATAPASKPASLFPTQHGGCLHQGCFC